MHLRRQNHENSSTLEVDYRKSISLIVLQFFVALDIGLLHSEHILYTCIIKTLKMLKNREINVLG